MNPILAALLTRIGAEAGFGVQDIQEANGVVVAEIVDGSRTATLVAGAENPPMIRGRRNHRSYGAYIIVDDGYGDWVKGDDVDECVAYILAWFRGREFRGSVSNPRSASLTLIPGESSFQQPILDSIRRELPERSSLREGERGTFLSPAGGFEARVELIGRLVRVTSAGGRLDIDAPTNGARAAAVLGFLDGCSSDSDE